MDTLIFLGYEILSAFLPVLVVFLIVRHHNVQKDVPYTNSHFLAVIVFSLYIVGVYHFTGAGTIYDGLLYGFTVRQNQLNFIPFSHTIDIVAYLLNILLFIPLGLLAPLFWQKMTKLTNVIGIASAFTLLIETSQLLNNRRTDIDDILLNILGAIVGYGFYKLLDRLAKSKFQANNQLAAELPICILTVFAARFLLFNEMGLAKLLYGF